MTTTLTPAIILTLRRAACVDESPFATKETLTEALATAPGVQPHWIEDELDGSRVGVLTRGSELIFFKPEDFQAAGRALGELQRAADLKVLGTEVLAPTDDLRARLAKAADSIFPEQQVPQVLKLAECILAGNGPLSPEQVDVYATLFADTRRSGIDPVELARLGGVLKRSSPADAKRDILTQLVPDVQGLAQVLESLGKGHLAEKFGRMAVLISWAQFNAGNYPESVKHARDVTLSVLSYSLAEEARTGRVLSDEQWLARLGAAWGHDLKNDDFRNLITHPLMSGAITERAAVLAGLDPGVAAVMGGSLAKLGDDQSFPIFNVLIPEVFGPRMPPLAPLPAPLEAMLDRVLARLRVSAGEWLPEQPAKVARGPSEQDFTARVSQLVEQVGSDRVALLSTLRTEATAALREFYANRSADFALPPWVLWVMGQAKLPLVEGISRARESFVTADETLGRWMMMNSAEHDTSKATARSDIENLSPSKFSHLYSDVMALMASFVGGSLPASIALFENRPDEQGPLARSCAQKVAYLLDWAVSLPLPEGALPHEVLGEEHGLYGGRKLWARESSAALKALAENGSVEAILKQLKDAQLLMTLPGLWGTSAEIPLKDDKDNALVQPLNDAFNRYAVSPPAGPLSALVERVGAAKFAELFPDYFPAPA